MKILAVLLAFALAILTGCGGDSSKSASKPTATKTVTAAPADDSTAVGMDKREEIYLHLLREAMPRYVAASDDTLLGLGRTICDTVQVDSPIEVTLGLVKGLTENGFSGTEAGEMLVYASALCPEKQAALTIDR